MALQDISSPTALDQVQFDPEYSIGPHNAVRVCLNIKPSEKVTVITDNATREIPATLVREIESVGATYNAFVLEELSDRSLTVLPAEIIADMESSDVSIFAVRVQQG